MSWFKCKHPFYALAVEKEVTEEIKDRDFIHVDYHLLCQICNERLTLKHARFLGGVDAFVNRAINRDPLQDYDSQG